MEPSSLALIAIVLVWAAYLAPQWIRRREALAHGRTGDRDSSRLRLLSPRRRAPGREHRSGGPVLSSPRVVLDTDGEPLFIPGERAVAARKANTSQPVSQAVAAPTKPAPVAAAIAPATPARLTAAIAGARVAAARRGRVLVLLGVALLASVGAVLAPVEAPGWLPAPVVGLLVVHLLASRVAAVRSREHLTLLTAQLRTAEELAARPKFAAPRPRPVAAPAAATPAPAARRPVAAGSETWSPVPVPPPTYTLKPAAPRPLPPPYEHPAAPATPAAATLGALPRRAEDVERILAIETSPFDTRRAVNE